MNNEEYVLIPLTDYTKLKQFAELGLKENKTMLNLNDIVFLASVCAKLNRDIGDEVTLHLFGTTGRIIVTHGRYEIINSTFDLALCSKYHDHVQKFIDEVL